MNRIEVLADGSAFRQLLVQHWAEVGQSIQVLDERAAYGHVQGPHPGQPLLAGRETDYPSVAELQDTYRGKERAATERLAGLLLATGRPQEAAELYRDLLRDPGPAEVERDGGNHYAYREQCARGLFECCRQLRDLGGLVRARDELLAILERLDAEDTVEEATRLGTATTSLFAEIYRELSEDNTPAAAAGDG